MNFSIQPTLETEHIILSPLATDDFDALYNVAADPKIWEQHPNKDRWKKEVFANFFKGALQSGGAFKIIDKSSNEFIGSTRFYDYNPADNSLLIGYTFYTTKYWGKGINHQVKRLMLNYIFNHVDVVYFHVGAQNIRSQIAMERLGAQKIAEQEVAYFGEPSRMNVVYEIRKENWV
ncbi:GNAT family N-acetyltransferase [Pedobacter montanisoli]|uniref:GNAT family N-acetyltransferase n=1 Tax=Pedobacter montanisoli TaxID=2923277 RepID=A0ABS9ZUZ7_9SPHI|nr:GNAT family N-acetyltransferase [Pedobacter montanisoli]MCJ0741864.1 GNAT family N-acetyltransferase [Pedobacter montanisoli]